MATKAADKILDLDNLAATLHKLRGQRRIVHCHGVFDLLHIGHIRHFEAARTHGDLLVVTLTPDVFVNKGPGRPAFAEQLRLEAVAALACVDYVALNRWPTATETLALLRPHVYAKGGEYRHAADDIYSSIGVELRAVADCGAEMVFTDDITFSSSALINTFLPTTTPAARDYLDGFKQRFSFGDISRCLDSCRDLRVLLIGETIIDEYCFCETLGKSGKEPILAVKLEREQRMIGGVLSVANHAASLSDHVQVLTQLGAEDSCRDVIAAQLDSRITSHFMVMPEAPTIRKRRYVEQYPFQKMFEVYVCDDTPSPANAAALKEAMQPLLADVDLVIVTDYGHGLLDSACIELICSEATHLAVNTQKNAGNHGFNTISKYRRADFVCISEHELRLDARERQLDINVLIERAAEQLDCRFMIVTRGQHGCRCYDRRRGIVDVPALTDQFRDRIGAGDALYTVTAMCARQGAPAEVVGLIGNAAGAQAVSSIGAAVAVDAVAIGKHLNHLLK